MSVRDGRARHVLRTVRHAVLPAAPAREHSVRHAIEHRLDAVDLAALDLEHLCEVPGPGLRRAGGHVASVRRYEVARVAGRVVEEAESEHEAALLVHCDESPVADPRDEVQEARLELLEAAPL